MRSWSNRLVLNRNRSPAAAYCWRNEDIERIKVLDTTLRDARQSMWATCMTTAMMLPVAGCMDRIGFDAIDLMRFVHFDVSVRMQVSRKRETQLGSINPHHSLLMESLGIMPATFKYWYSFG